MTAAQLSDLAYEALGGSEQLTAALAARVQAFQGNVQVLADSLSQWKIDKRLMNDSMVTYVNHKTKEVMVVYRGTATKTDLLGPDAGIAIVGSPIGRTAEAKLFFEKARETYKGTDYGMAFFLFLEFFFNLKKQQHSQLLGTLLAEPRPKLLALSTMCLVFHTTGDLACLRPLQLTPHKYQVSYTRERLIQCSDYNKKKGHTAPLVRLRQGDDLVSFTSDIVGARGPNVQIYI